MCPAEASSSPESFIKKAGKMFSSLFKKKNKTEVPVGKPPAESGLPPTKPKTAEEAKREAIQHQHTEELERAKPVDDTPDESVRKKASRRISQTQFGKPLSYNAYITQQAKQQ